MVLLGPAVYFTLEVAKARKWCKFEDRFVSYPSFVSLADGVSGSFKQGSFKQETRELNPYHQDVNDMLVEEELGAQVPHALRFMPLDIDKAIVFANNS